MGLAAGEGTVILDAFSALKDKQAGAFVYFTGLISTC